MNEPLIYTSRGNVPESELTYEKSWKYDGDCLWFHEAWHFADGSLAKNNVHGIRIPGLPIDENCAPKSGDVTVGLQGVGMGGQQAVM